MKTETLYRKKQVNHDAWIIAPSEFTMYHTGNGAYEILEPVEVSVGESEKVTHVLPNHIPDSGKMVEKVQELEKQLESECEDIHKAIEILDGNESPIDWRKGGSELLRKLCEHLEFFHETESELEEARKNAVVWQFGGQGKTLGWKVEELGNGMLRVQGGFTHCTIPLPPDPAAPVVDEAEEAWDKIKYDFGSQLDAFKAGFRAGKEKK